MTSPTAAIARLLAVSGGLLLCLPAPSVLAAQPPIVGWIERVRLGADGLIVAAKLDTGADTSSLHAENLRREKRADGEWVAFDVVGAGGETVRLEHKVVRIARIKRDSAPAQKRPVIMMGVCLGNLYALTEVNLTDRGQFNYEMLVGRSFLARRFAVDSARTYTVEPACPESRAR
jgi:hypothetical protein